jgi:hypothetical protein
MDGASRSGLEAVLLDLAPVDVILGTPLSFATEKVSVFLSSWTIVFICSEFMDQWCVSLLNIFMEALLSLFLVWIDRL